MKRLLLAFSVISILFYGCGEAGFESDISKNTEATFTIESARVNDLQDNNLEVSESFDFANDEFGDYIDDAESFRIGKLSYEISDYSNTSGDVVSVDFVLSVTNSGTDREILTISDLTIENTGVVLVYEEGNTTSLLSASQIASLESVADLVENRQSADFKVSIDFTQDIDSDFDLTFYFDLTARVQLD